jgi:hypothetical protein
MEQLETEYPCDYCGRHARCFRQIEVRPRYSLRVNNKLICPEAYQYIHHYVLIKNALSSLVDDVRFEIMKKYNYLKQPCVLSKEKLIEKRNQYLNVNFNTLTLKQLQQLTVERLPHKYKKSRQKSYFNNLLNNDKNVKMHEWKYDFYYKDF